MGKFPLKKMPFYLNSYKLPTPSSLSITPSTTRTTLSQSSPLPSSLHIFPSSLQTAITTVQTKPIASGCLKAHTFTTDKYPEMLIFWQILRKVEFVVGGVGWWGVLTEYIVNHSFN